LEKVEKKAFVQGAHGLNGDTLNGVNVSWWDESLGEKKTHLFYALKRIILPRQARDKHRGKLEKRETISCRAWGSAGAGA
jgi:hypothetical protein